MAAETSFNARFNYQHIPECLIDGQATGSVWPGLSLKPNSDLTDLRTELGTGLTSLSFDYRFSNGESIDCRGHNRRLQWGLIETLDNIPPLTRCAIIAESDPYFAYLAAEMGWSDVDFICSRRDLMTKSLDGLMEKTIKVLEFSELLRDDQRSYELIVLVDAAELNPNFEMEVLSAYLMLAPGGKIIIVAPVIEIPKRLRLKTLWPYGTEARAGRKLAYMTVEYISELLNIYGFSELSCADRFGEVANDKLRPEVEKFASSFLVDPDHLLCKAIIVGSASLTPYGGVDRRRELIASWLSRHPFDLFDIPLDGLAGSVRATIATLQGDLDAERKRRERAEQGIADRDVDLARTRTSLAATAVDADYHREQLIQARAEVAHLANRYELLLSRIEYLQENHKK